MSNEIQAVSVKSSRLWDLSRNQRSFRESPHEEVHTVTLEVVGRALFTKGVFTEECLAGNASLESACMVVCKAPERQPARPSNDLYKRSNSPADPRTDTGQLLPEPQRSVVDCFEMAQIEQSTLQCSPKSRHKSAKLWPTNWQNLNTQSPNEPFLSAKLEYLLMIMNIWNSNE